MVVEMVGSFTLLVPAMGAVAVSKLILGDTTIFRAQVPTKAQSGAHRGEYNRETLEGILVRDVMIPRDKVIVLSPVDDPEKVFSYVASTSHTGFPVLENERLVGIISITDVRKAKKEEGACQTVGDLMTKAVIGVQPEDTLETALALMVTRHINHLPVVTKERLDQLAGFITRTDILQAYARFSKHMSCEVPSESSGK
jgi:CIC family chloride channel protein